MAPPMIAHSTRFDQLLVTLIWGEVTLDDVESLRLASAAMHAKNQRWAMLVDARNAQAPSSKVRRALADMSNTFQDETKRNSICVAVVFESSILIGVLTAVRWFLKTDVELRYFKTPTEAMVWVDEKCKAENLRLNAGAMSFMKKLDTATMSDVPSFGDKL